MFQKEKVHPHHFYRRRQSTRVSLLALFFCLLPALIFAAPLKINNDSQYTNSTAVTLNLSLQDIPNGNNVSQMSFSNNNASWTTPESYNSTKSWNLSPQGNVTGNGKVNIGDAMFIAQYLAGKRQFTPEQLALADVNQNNKIDIGDSMFIAQYLARIRPSLPLVSGEAQRTVYVKFKDKAGNWSNVYSDTIMLVPLPPTTTFSKDEGSNWRNTSLTFALTSVDSSGAGVDKIYYSIDGSSPSILYTGPVTFSKEGIYDVKFYAVDKLGQAEPIKSALKYDYIIIDKTPPQKGSIKINNGSQHTNSRSVVLDLSAEDSLTGMSEMQNSNENANWDNPKDYRSGPRDYDTQRNWSLTLGDGVKTVYVRFKDRVGNWSNPVSATIILDTTPPQITSLNVANGSTLYENDEAIISPQISDLSFLEYQFNIDGVIKQAWSEKNNYKWVPASPGRHNIKVEAKDISGQDNKWMDVYVFRKPIEPL
ncbi:MAG: dockerin type I domain-containing protein [Candidatus Omnitrophota bacterium]|nr:dockerin type I domain-containing protein [Candidatus Omnitrophota bacterium]